MSFQNECQVWRERLDTDAHDGLVSVDDRGTNDYELAAHLEGCADCRALFGQRAAVTHLVRNLSRQTVPADLDGRVVSTFHAGQREDRVALQLERLGRCHVPSGLEQRVAHDLSAPPVLDRLVAESLDDLPRTVSRGMTNKLSRLEAPTGLAARIEQRLLFPHRERRGMRAPVSFVAAAALAIVVGLWVARPGNEAAHTGDVARWTFDVQRGTALEPGSLDPETRSLVESLLPLR